MCPDVTSFAVSPTDLQALDTFVAARAEQAHAAVHRLHGEAAALFGGGWQGPAASAFGLSWEQWAEGARIVLAALDETATLVGASAAAYAATDDGVRAAVGRSPV
jgi:WXG100 family type VII secretion target